MIKERKIIQINFNIKVLYNALDSSTEYIYADISLYKTMLEIRVFEESLCEYIENGTIKTPCHLYIGQEAVATGLLKFK